MKHAYTAAQIQAASLSQLRPISEAGPVPEGCVRVYGYHHDPESRWALTTWQDSQDTHFADIRPTHSTRMTNDEIITNDRLFDLVRYARAILHAADLITDSEYVWLCSRNQGEPSQLRAANYELIERLAEARKSHLAVDDAVRRMEAVPWTELRDLCVSDEEQDDFETIRWRLIQAAKGEQI